VSIDPWSDDEPAPRWIGQQAGCALGLVVGTVGIVLFVAALLVFYVLVRG
jgi:hypothetical protein